jgi:hypothetical protein
VPASGLLRVFVVATVLVAEVADTNGSAVPNADGADRAAALP